MDKRIVGWLIEPLNDEGEVIDWIKNFPSFLSILDYPNGPPYYGPEFRVTPLIKLEEN